MAGIYHPNHSVETYIPVRGRKLNSFHLSTMPELVPEVETYIPVRGRKRFSANIDQCLGFRIWLKPISPSGDGISHTLIQKKAVIR